MNLWVDDLRTAPEGWTWARNSKEAMRLLANFPVALLSLDHDLGGEDTAYIVCLFMAENDLWPTEGIDIHSANPVGVKNMGAVIRRYSPFSDSGYTGRCFR